MKTQNLEMEAPFWSRGWSMKRPTNSDLLFVAIFFEMYHLNGVHLFLYRSNQLKLNPPQALYPNQTSEVVKKSMRSLHIFLVGFILVKLTKFCMS